MGAGARFFAGAFAFFLGDRAITRMGYRDRKSIAGAAPPESGLPIVLGIVLDGVPESAVIGLTVLETGSVGVGVLVAVFINLPESVADLEPAGQWLVTATRPATMGRRRFRVRAGRARRLRTARRSAGGRRSASSTPSLVAPFSPCSRRR